MATALQQYINTGSFSTDGLITTGSIGITQNITGSLNIYNGYNSNDNSITVTGSILTSGSIIGIKLKLILILSAISNC